uniref:Uncharacterized protein n=1 Tax=Aegilops tauschii subsp. strangulata TaxID=200361 RepID=A0A453SLM7_AEGTS
RLAPPSPCAARRGAVPPRSVFTPTTRCRSTATCSSSRDQTVAQAQAARSRTSAVEGRDGSFQRAMLLLRARVAALLLAHASVASIQGTCGACVLNYRCLHVTYVGITLRLLAAMRCSAA